MSAPRATAPLRASRSRSPVPGAARALAGLVLGLFLATGTAGADEPWSPSVGRAGRDLPASGPTDEVLHRIEAVARRDDRRALRGIARDLDREAEGSADRDYARALVAYRLAVALDLERDHEEMRSELATARALLERHVERRPGEPETTALLVAVLGRQIALRPFLGVFLGRRANDLVERASARHPDHPRLTLQRGILAFFMPASLGGGPEKAESLLRRALDLLDLEEPGADPGWGRMDALIWLARSLDEQGRGAEAREVYEEALRLAPELALLRNELAELRRTTPDGPDREGSGNRDRHP